MLALQDIMLMHKWTDEAAKEARLREFMKAARYLPDEQEVNQSDEIDLAAIAAHQMMFGGSN